MIIILHNERFYIKNIWEFWIKLEVNPFIINYEHIHISFFYTFTEYFQFEFDFILVK